MGSSISLCACRPSGLRREAVPSLFMRDVLRAHRHRCVRRLSVLRFISGAATGELLQRRHVEQLELAAANLQQALTLKARQQAAHRFELEAEIAADLLARHS